jgi:PHD/YefM family antitoxin component YafN of YafNO toxin-antitoxin module
VVALDVDVLVRGVERLVSIEVDRWEVLVLTEGEVRSENTSDHVVEAHLSDGACGESVKELLTKKIIRSASLSVKSRLTSSG